MNLQDYESLLSLSERRHSCRSFQPQDSLSEEEVQRILEIARHSPFASGRKNWRIAAITDKAVIKTLAEEVREEAASLAEKMESTTAQFFRHYAKSFTIFEDAPLLMIPYCRETSTMKSLLRDNATDDILAWEHENLTKSLSCVAMMILLAAESLDLGACYMTGPLMAGKSLNKVLSIPEGAILGAIIPVGHKQDQIPSQ